MAAEPTPGLAPKPHRDWRYWLRTMGPGIITGAAGDDPAGIGTYAQTGAQSGTGLLWLLLLATPMLQAVQITAAKLGVVTQKGLAALLREQYGLRIAVFAVAITAIANIATIGADIAAIGTALGMVFHFPWQWSVIPVTMGIWYFQVYRDYAVIRRALLILALALLAYVVAGFLVRPAWLQVLRDTFIPQFEFNLGYIATSVGLLGTTISPYMYFFQSAQEVEEGKPVKKLPEVTVDTTAGMIFTNLISYFIILSTAATLHAHGVRDIDTAEQAARALEPFAGAAAKYVFAVGVIGAGLLAVPVLAASTAAMVGGVAGWRVGLSKTTTRAKGYYLALSVALFMGLAITLSGLNPVKALFYSQVITGLVAPVVLFFLFRLARRRDLLGDRVNSWAQQAWGWITVGLMGLAGLLLVWSVVTGRA